jgi:hypothetical protein
MLISRVLDRLEQIETKIDSVNGKLIDALIRVAALEHTEREERTERHEHMRRNAKAVQYLLGFLSAIAVVVITEVVRGSFL